MHKDIQYNEANLEGLPDILLMAAVDEEKDRFQKFWKKIVVVLSFIESSHLIILDKTKSAWVDCLLKL